MNAEWLAFTFTENYRGGESFEWGTYYGPLGVFVDANGKRVERPSVEEVTAEILMYWEQRAQAARHPTLRMRYADLVWEFGRRAKQSVTAALPRLVIDATLLGSKSGLFPGSRGGFTALKRALDLALSLRDEERIVAVRDALVAYEDRVADDSLAGTWGRAFDELVENKPKNVPMPPDLIAKLVSDLEARLDRLAHPAAPGSMPDGFAVEAAALPLARHYRRPGDGAAMRRALRVFGQAFSTMATPAAPMLAMSWLERVLDTYRSFGLAEECEAIEVRLRELGPGALSEMKQVSTPVNISTDDLERFLATLTTGTLQEVLFRVAAHFVPTKKDLEHEVRRLAKLAPLSAVFTQKIMDWEGRLTAQVGSVEADLEGHIVRRASQNMQFEAPWLRAVIARLLERLQPAVTDLRDHLLASPIFDARKAPILERGLAAYLGDDGVVAAPVLIPQVEDALRNIVRLSGGSTYRSHRRGGLMLKTLDDLLREEAVVETLGESVAHYFQVLFTDQRGWNIRNDVCHGISPVQAFSWAMTDRIFHALLILATVREKEGETGGQQ